MKRTFKTILTVSILIMALAVCTFAMPMAVIANEAEACANDDAMLAETSGVCDDNLSCALADEGTLTISGEEVIIDIGEKTSESNLRYYEIDGNQLEIINDDNTLKVYPEKDMLVEITEKDSDGNLVKSQYFHVDMGSATYEKLDMDSYMHSYNEKSIRIKEPMGIRFKAHVLTSAKFEETKFVIDEYGYVIATKSSLGESELTLNTEKKAVGVGYSREKNIDVVFEGNDEKHIFTGVLKNIPASQYKTDLVCKTYTKITVDGETFTLYGEAVTGNVFDTAKPSFVSDCTDKDVAKIIFDYICCAGNVGESFSNAKLETSAKNGRISVDGSFDNAGSAQETYTVYLVTYDKDGAIEKVEKSADIAMSQGANEFSCSFDIISKEQITKAFVLTSDLVSICTPFEKTLKSLRLLSIGNSFSIDAQEWLYGIAKDGGIDNVVLGNLYIGGCSLQTHYNNSVSGSAAYTYYKNSTGTWKNTASQTMLHGLTDENWDYITLQQNSGNSGSASTYEPYLSNLISYVNANKTNPDAELVWHMTWAYDKAYASTSSYGSQDVMYTRIIDATQQKIVNNDSFSFIIPAGTAVQNARTSYIGDKFNRDGFHLDYNYGRYLAGLTWFHKITGLPVDYITYIPNNSFSKEYLEILKEAAKNAILNPFEITQSVYTENPEEEENLDDYVLINWEPKTTSFYNSTGGSSLNEGSELAKRFISSKMFTKETLPVGSIIVVDSGYGYRPEGWTDLGTKNDASTRPANVTVEKVVVDEAWWGDFNYRAFNLYKTDSSNIDTIFDEAKTHLKIYVHKSLVDEEEDEYQDIARGYIDWEPMKDLYYNSLGSSTPSTNEGNKNKFICSKIFTREELPVGTVIEVDAGYQYRPEGWTELDAKNASRPNNVKTERVVIDEAWWGDFNYRAFNLSKTDLSDICSDFEESCTHLRIYVPFDSEIDIPVGDLYQ